MGKLSIILLLVVGCTVHTQIIKPGESTIKHTYRGPYDYVSRGSYEVYPKYHPGDMFALDKEIGLKLKFSGSWVALFTGADPIDDYKIIVVESFWKHCNDECNSKFNCNQYARLTPEGDKCYKKYEDIYKNCFATCSDEKYGSTSIARHIIGGEYTDSSYYERGDFSYFNNIHPEKDLNEKTKWQKDRDECMQIIFRNEANKFEMSKLFEFNKKSLINKYAKSYRNCLKERGYLLGDKKEQ